MSISKEVPVDKPNKQPPKKPNDLQKRQQSQKTDGDADIQK